MTRLVSFLIQAALVVVAVLVFSFFDPFGMFASKKQKLMDTPITVESIREIGKFISAEYDGEVISSLTDLELQQLEVNKNTLKSIDSAFRSAIIELRNSGERIRNKNHLLDTFHRRYPKVWKDTSYNNLYFKYLQEKYHEKKEKNIIDKVVSNENISLDFDPAVLPELDKSDRKNFFASKKTLKKQIVMLGRGSVKAGFDFEKFTEKNFKYDASRNRIYLIGMKADILSCNINPWFIPDKRVKGFEIVVYTSKANDPHLMNMVKQDCQNKLCQSALDADIIGKAEENGVQNLKLFFSLLLDNNNIEVILANNLLDVYRDQILMDSVVSSDELQIMDSVIAKAENYTLGYDTAQSFPMAQEFVNDLKTRKFYFRKNLSTLSCYSSIAYDIISDSTVDSLEYVRLVNLKPTADSSMPCEKYWFNDSNESHALETKRKLYNIAIADIANNTRLFIQSPQAKKKLSRKNTAQGNNDSLKIDSLLNDLKK